MVPQLGEVIDEVLRFASGDQDIDPDEWERGRYCPTPTIIEAPLALYKQHSVDDITRLGNRDRASRKAQFRFTIPGK